ncbi:MAG TPA: serine hydrolase domain-containing protein [Microbacterium sp.]|nr:serine hydrolase domain-containing protein [Microbacterium sp.]
MRSSLSTRHGTRLAALAVASALLLVSAGCTAETVPADSGSPASPTQALDAATIAQFQKALDDTRAAGGFPGVIATVISPQGTWVGTSGVAAAGTDRVPTPTDRTRVGSLTKTMTATILLQLVEEGDVSLDDTVEEYVPGMPNGDVATLRQLADMSSGIPSYTGDPKWQQEAFADPEKHWTPDELVGFVADAPPDFAPGQGWSYSNTNYVLLGMVIEQVTGQPIADVFAQRIFDPLGMTDTSFPTGTNALPDPHLDGVTGQGQPEGQTADATNFSPSIAYTAGEVISTLDDLKKWGDALFTGEGILNPDTQQLRRESIIRDIPPANSDTAGYGLGIGVHGDWWGHDGAIPGYTTSLSYSYALDTTVIVITNSDVPFDIAGGTATPAPAVLAALTALLG